MIRKQVKYCTVILLIAVLFTGCSKDEILNNYNHVIETAGAKELTSDHALLGTREKGIDDYTGTYRAEYKGDSAKEILFGGTSIDREEGKDLTINCTVTMTEGTVKLLWYSGSEEPVVLLDKNGEITQTITIPDGGNYFGIECENFYGNIDLSIQ